MQDGRNHGRDSLQLAEIPIALLADRVAKGVGSVVFKTDQGELTVVGSADYGLPTAVDGDIIVALLYISKRANDYTDRVVNFCRMEIIDLLGWRKTGGNYKRIDEGLQRWVGVTLRFNNCWFDNTIKKTVDASFHILDYVITYNRDVRQQARTLQHELPFSRLAWNDIFFDSIKSGYVKKLDINMYFSLDSSISRQMMRYLDKKFYIKNMWTFDLREFAFNKIALSRNYSDGDLRKKLQIGFDELRSVGFLRSSEFVSPRRGQWLVKVVGGRAETTGSQADDRQENMFTQ